jgi:hypothetical protein
MIGLENKAAPSIDEASDGESETVCVCACVRECVSAPQLSDLNIKLLPQAMKQEMAVLGAHPVAADELVVRRPSNRRAQPDLPRGCLGVCVCGGKT